MAKFNWGSADSGPWTLEARVCDAKEGANGPCGYIDSVLPPFATATLERGREAAMKTEK